MPMTMTPVRTSSVTQVETPPQSDDPDHDIYYDIDALYPLSAELIVEDERWQHVKDIMPSIQKALTATYHKASPDTSVPADMTLVLHQDDFIHQLNRDYRQKDKPTNVLSFHSYDRSEIDGVYQAAKAGGPPVMLGDVFLAFETCQVEAAAQGKSVHDHTLHLCVHGLLHLLGYDHVDGGEAEQMESLEVMILSELGIADPYKTAQVTADSVQNAEGEK